MSWGRYVVMLLYIRQDIPSTLLITLRISENLERFFVELNFPQKKIVSLLFIGSAKVEYYKTTRCHWKES